jgi:hypothetical protein
MGNASGTPVIGTATLTNGAIGPTQFTLYTVMGSNPQPLQPNERVVIDQILITSNDPALALVTVDTDSSVPTKLVSAYATSSFPAYSENFAPGTCRGAIGLVPRISASAVSAGKQISAAINGHIQRVSP